VADGEADQHCSATIWMGERGDQDAWGRPRVVMIVAGATALQGMIDAGAAIKVAG
jgi:hypothetical protein